MNMNGGRDASVPLREWIAGEAKKQHSAQQQITVGISAKEKEHNREILILRKTTVAYGIAELLRHARDHPILLGNQCSIDNFAVRTPTRSEGRVLNDIKGVDMLSPRKSLNIVEPSFLRSSFADGSTCSDGSCEIQEDRLGKYLEVEFLGADSEANSNDCATVAVCQNEEDGRCHSLGVLLYELFSHISPFLAEAAHNTNNKREIVSGGHAQKRIRLLASEYEHVTEVPSSAQAKGEMAHGSMHTATFIPLVELGFPSSICLMVQSLLDCGKENRPDEAYDSLEEVIKDLHLLLLDPSRFLFGHQSSPDNKCPQLSFREHKLYGRENEVSLITDAFCRVSAGKSEAFFIGGFSGSGKSMLVNSLKARVDMAEGYVLSHKFDQISKERPVLEVISAFNDLCPLIKEKTSEKDLVDIVKNLMDVFGNDLSVLAQLLPNIQTISPQLKLAGGDKDGGDHMNLRSICFTLRRFMRVVSSKSHPVMLFLDDLQWCDNPALSVVEGILCDEIGSGCLFFVGSYRSNEVQEDHAIFPLMDSLKSSGVPITSISLEGLNPEDLNTMISDALCMFPRICEPLSDMVFQKTKGNPFFVLAFLRSLVDRGLLEFCVKKGRFVWDEDRISSMDITGNVLYLLSSKMSGLSDTIQSALKVAACFGTKMKDSVVEYLSTISEYSDLRCGLEQVIQEGFMIKVGASEFKFVHDKVREAAYSLISDSEKDQYHFDLGMALYNITKGKDVDDILFSVADQINHGIENLPVGSCEVRVDLAKLYKSAGVKAVKCSDFVTARSYLSIAYSLLPADHWERHYDLSQQLLCLWAKSAYSCGDAKNAQDILQEVLSKCQCIQDKLPAYFLLVTILHACDDTSEAYNMCHEVLSQLGEEIPLSLDPKSITKMIEETSKTLNNISDIDLLEMKEMEAKLRTTLKFYSLMGIVAWFAKPEMLSFVTCRMVHLTMKHGICKYSIVGFVQFALVLCGSERKDTQGASRIGEAAMSCFKKRFHTAAQLPTLYSSYYGLVAFHNQPLQLCADYLRQGFDTGMSLGENGTAFLNAIQHIKTSLFAGEQLSKLLERVDYYLRLCDQYKNDLTKTYMLIFRDTISELIDKGENTGSKTNSHDVTMENTMKHANSSESMYFHRAIRAYWLGHSERCHHYIGKVLERSPDSRKLNSYVVSFIHGLNSFQVLKRQNTAKLRSVPKNAIAMLKKATLSSRWNFRNKVHLLEAELFSFLGNHEEAKASYAAAITSARCSRFTHEQGLACELAGYHYRKMGDIRNAWSFFHQAKQCYAEWGSQMKVDSITRQLESFNLQAC